MKQIGLCLLFAVAIQSLCYADVTKLSSEDRRVLQDSSRFHEVHSTSDLPSAIIRFVSARMAGSQNQARTGMRLMSSRTQIFQANVSFGQQQEASITSSITNAVWRAVGGPLKDYAAFVDALQSGKLDDRLDYAH